MRSEIVINFIASSILIISLIKTKYKTNFPFLLFAIVGILNDIVSEISIITYQTNAINSNIYVLLSSILITRQIQIWNTNKSINFTYLFCYIAIILVWSVENLMLSNLLTFNILNRIIIYSIIISICCKLLTPLSIWSQNENRQDLIFIITVILIIKYSIYVVSEIMWLNATTFSLDFRLFIFNVMVLSNPIINLMMAITILWVPRRLNIT